MKTGLEALVKEGAQTATNVIKVETRDTYRAHFKKFIDFCILNDYLDPHVTRHYELPAVLVAYMQSVSTSASVSLQTAEKTRSAVANYYSSYENSDGTDSNTWSVKENDNGEKQVVGNPARDSFVRQFMRGLKKRKNSEYVSSQAAPISLQMLSVLHGYLDTDAGLTGFTTKHRLWFKAVSSLAFYGICCINEVLSIKRGDIALYQRRSSQLNPGEEIEFGTYVLHDRKTEVTEGCAYNLHAFDRSEATVDAYAHVKRWAAFVEDKKNHNWDDGEFMFPALA